MPWIPPVSKMSTNLNSLESESVRELTRLLHYKTVGAICNSYPGGKKRKKRKRKKRGKEKSKREQCTLDEWVVRGLPEVGSLYSLSKRDVTKH